MDHDTLWQFYEKTAKVLPRYTSRTHFFTSKLLKIKNNLCLCYNKKNGKERRY